MKPILRVVLCLALIPGAVLGCGKLPSRARASAQSGPGAGPGSAAAGEAGLSPVTGFEMEGLRFSIREAAPSKQPHLQSPFELGDPISVQALVSSDRAELAQPVRWPAREAGRLVLEVAPAPSGGQWSYRCLFADGAVAEDSQQEGRVQALVSDRERGVGLVLLEQVFGPRGERHDPATQCHLELRIPSRPPLVVSLRALGALPEMERKVLEDQIGQGSSLEEGIRTEHWTNPSQKRVTLTLNPRVDVESRQEVRVLRHESVEPDREPKGDIRIKRIRGKGFEVEASVDGGAWRLAALVKVIFGPGESREIRFRLRLGDSMRRIPVPAPVRRTVTWVTEGCAGRGCEIDIHRKHSKVVEDREDLVATRFAGSILFKGMLQEAGGWGEAREIGNVPVGLSPGGAADVPGDAESFDEEGFVP